MTYEQRLQKEAEELAKLHWRTSPQTKLQGRWEILTERHRAGLMESYIPLAAHLLAKQAETAEDAHRVGYMCKAEGDNIGLSRKTYLIETGLVPQTNQDEEITE